MKEIPLDSDERLKYSCVCVCRCHTSRCRMERDKNDQPNDVGTVCASVPKPPPLLGMNDILLFSPVIPCCVAVLLLESSKILFVAVRKKEPFQVIGNRTFCNIVIYTSPKGRSSNAWVLLLCFLRKETSQQCRHFCLIVESFFFSSMGWIDELDPG